MNEHFVSSYQKVGTFKIVNGQKQGGNVATYFCMPDGTVLDVIAGPVDAKKFLQAARWVVETHKTALTESNPKPKQTGVLVVVAQDRRRDDLDDVDIGPTPPPAVVPNKPKITKATPAHNTFFRKAHAERFMAEFSPNMSWRQPNANVPTRLPMHMSKQAQTQWLLASYQSPKVKDIYKIVYEDILRERISNLPVDER